jgi:ferritin-like metal-binding protein YciE
MGTAKETVATYVGDMHALEEHMLKAFEAQLELSKDTPEAHRVVQQLVSSSRKRITALDQRVTALGQTDKTISDWVKTAVSTLAGYAAGAIDMVRPQQVSKALRDSYTALNLAVISYVMLDTTGQACQDQETAQLAQRHLLEVIANTQAIASVMPALVVADLSDNVPGISADVATRVCSNEKLSGVFGSKARTHTA